MHFYSLKGNMKVFNILIILILFPLGVSAQAKHYNIKWNLSQISSKNIRPDAVILFDKTHYLYDEDNIYFGDSWQDNSFIDDSSLRIFNVKMSPISKSDVKFLLKKELPDNFNAKLKSSYARDKIISTFSINTLIKKGNLYYKLDSFDVQYSYSKQSGRTITQNIYDSKWNNGNWYRFKIEKSGVYKLTKKFLKDLGVDVNNVNPKKLKIFGNGADLMPLKNDVSYPEDISEVAIEFVGEQDGRIDDSDYILFYAQGPEWSAENDTNLNIYTDNFYYFVQIDNQDGKRIEQYQEPSGSVSQTFNDYTAYKFYEKDETNFTRLGRKFFEKPFSNSNNSKEISFKFNNLNTSKPIIYRVLGGTEFKGPTSFSVTLNNQHLGTISLNASGNTTAGDEGFIQGTTNVSNNTLNFQISYNDNGNFDARFYLNYVNISAYCELKGFGYQFIIYNKDEISGNGIGSYNLTNASDITRIWNITDRYNPKYINNSSNSIDIKFNLGTNQKFIAIDKNDIFTPIKPDNPKMNNQNLHKDVFYFTGQFKDLDMLIITPSFLHQKAQEMADFHQNFNQNVFVADLDKIYNEFGTGSQDIAAIRNFVKYVYNNASTPTKRLKYLFLFGDASVDYKGLLEDYQLSNGKNTNIVPIYQTLDGNSLVSSFCSDDFYALMDTNEGQLLGNEQPDIATGRFIVSNEQEADVLINKYKHYFKQVSLKPWRTNISLWADDWDKSSDDFIKNVENVVATGLKQYHPEFNVQKLYMDAYVQIQTPGGARYPQAKRDLLNLFEKGSLLIGYIGHGNEHVLTHERMLTLQDVENMRNYDRLPVFTTLTCDFGRFDNPSTETTAEHLIWNDKGGVLALVTTVREIWITSADVMNILFYENIFGTSNSLNGNIEYYPSEVLRKVKNQYGGTTKYLINFLGDPGLPLGIPKPKIVLTGVNGHPTDTLKALQHISIKGEIRDINNQLQANYNGNVYPVIFDKYQQAHTLQNDGPAERVDFEKLGRTIFRGNASVQNGKFQFDFIVPRDINVAYGKGRISFYAEDSEHEKIGYDETITVGGIDANAEQDDTPPQIKLYMNDTNFADGGITDSNPYLLVHLEDEHGINTVGGVGHDITAVLDDNVSDVYVLNDYYQTEPNTYKQGKIRYRLNDIKPGWHTITVKAWDVYNNSISEKITFQVVSNEEIKIDRVLNYPNPFVDYTEFWFNHNHPYENLDVMIQVYTISGKLVWQHRQNVITTSFLSRDIIWDGRDNFGNKLAKGVYIYKLSVRTSSGKIAKKIEKLVIL